MKADYRGMRRPKPKGTGRYRSGRADISERAEELLRRAARKARKAVARVADGRM